MVSGAIHNMVARERVPLRCSVVHTIRLIKTVVVRELSPGRCTGQRIVVGRPTLCHQTHIHTCR